MPIKIIVEKTSDGYSAYADTVNVFTIGSDLEEIKMNMLEALKMYFENENQSVTLDSLEISMETNQLV